MVGITNTKDIANKIEVNIQKVQRVLKSNNLGAQRILTPKKKRNCKICFSKSKFILYRNSQTI